MASGSPSHAAAAPSGHDPPPGDAADREPTTDGSASERQVRLLRVAERVAGATSEREVADAVVVEGAEALQAANAGLWLLQPGDTHARLACAVRYGEAMQTAFEVIALDQDLPVSRAMLTREPLWFERREKYEHDFAHAARQTGPWTGFSLASFACLPLGTAEHATGVLAVAFEDARILDPDERRFLLTLARMASVAIERIRLQGRLERLQRVTAALSAATTLDEVARVATEVVVDVLGLLSAVLWFVDSGGDLVLLRSTGVPESYIGSYRRLPKDSDLPAVRVLRSRQPLWVETEAALEDASADLAERVRGARRFNAFSVFPLVVEGRAFGVLGFAHAGWRRFTDDQRSFLASVAAHCAQALDRARSLQAGRQADNRLALLARAGETFSASIDYEATLRRVVALALPTLGDYGFFDIVEADGVRRFADAHDDPETARHFQSTRYDPDHFGECALTTGVVAFHPHIDEAWLRERAVHPQVAEGMRSRGLRSLLSVPLLSRGERVGALTFCFARSGRQHTAADLDTAEELARRATVAIEQARLYAAARDAARRADAANRMKDEFLATVSHELRTPLNAILGWAAMLVDGPRDEARCVRGLAVIRRNAEMQAKLVDDMLDVSRIVTGKLKIEPRAVEAVAIAREAIDVVRTSADARSIAIELDEPGGSGCPLVADPERLRQVLWNLLSNAVKFTDAGGRVDVRLAAGEAGVTIEVHDTGRGIAPEFLPYVFERFKQADQSTTRAFGGLGLGLAIVRHIVELHGGQVEAESPGLGRGATFRVTLPDRTATRGA